MTIIVNSHPNASTNVNGIEFARDEQGRMCSVGPVTGEMLAILLAIPDFAPAQAAATTGPEQASEPEQSAQSSAGEAAAAIPAITGTTAEDGTFSLNIPLPDGSSLNLQGTGANSPAPELELVQGESGDAAKIADKLNAEEKPAARKAAKK